MSDQKRKEELMAIARGYVEALGAGNFDGIPYHEDVALRAPINPGGSDSVMVGREELRSKWWAPLPTLVSGTTFIDSFVNADMSAVAAEFHCHISEPKCTLRIVDRFGVDSNGQITSQENFFDPRALTG